MKLFISFLLLGVYAFVVGIELPTWRLALGAMLAGWSNTMFDAFWHEWMNR